MHTRRMVLATLLFVTGGAAARPEAAVQAPAQEVYERALLSAPSPEQLRAHHDLLGSAPHVAGTEGGMRNVELLASYFESLGLEVERHEAWVYLPSPVDAALEIVSPDRVALELKERALADDPYSGREGLSVGWNAYSGNGDVTAEVVYVNYGTKEDFETLATMGVSVAGKIAIARYGGNFRGYKAKFAEAAGAVGLVIYTDPADSGWARGLMWPEGGWANPWCIQRGSLVTLAHQGDPLTPFVEATEDAARLDPQDVALPRIPVQPVGWEAASQILSQMRGVVVPHDAGRGWQGGLPFPYRLTGGEGLRVRLMVRQDRRITRIVNVVGTLRGVEEPERKVVVGCHHDAWAYGADDPLSGLIVVMESARSIASAAAAGMRARRSILFAGWDAEEFGIIGSSEWVERHAADLSANCVAYINLDAAVSGPEFSAGASPSLGALMMDAARATPARGDAAGRTLFDGWLARSRDKAAPEFPSIGTLGGGSDHVGFVSHLAIAGASMSMGGGEGTAYHSLYDNLAWYRRLIGDDYGHHAALTGAVNVAVARLANEETIPLDIAGGAREARRRLGELRERALARGFAVDTSALERLAEATEARGAALRERVRAMEARGALSPSQRDAVNAGVLAVDRAWFDPQGMPGRPWHRNLFVAPDEDSGYASWPLAAMRWAVERGEAEALAPSGALQRRYEAALARIEGAYDAIEAAMGEDR